MDKIIFLSAISYRKHFYLYNFLKTTDWEKIFASKPVKINAMLNEFISGQKANTMSEWQIVDTNMTPRYEKGGSCQLYIQWLLVFDPDRLVPGCEV